MGLDIIAARNVVWHPMADDYDEGLICAYPNPDFPAHADGMRAGIYSHAGRHRFRAGSYSGYNEWRAWLCRVALNVDPTVVWHDPRGFAGQPFMELIGFSDCEGMIGPTTSAKLSADFEDMRGRSLASVLEVAPAGYRRVFDHFAHAFALASDEGLVQFS